MVGNVLIIHKSIIKVIRLNGWSNPFEAGFFSWNHSSSTPPSSNVDIANFQLNSMKGTSNTLYHKTFKK